MQKEFPDLIMIQKFFWMGTWTIQVEFSIEELISKIIKS